MSERKRDEFLKMVKKTRKCWEWMGYRLPTGYGRFKGKATHRLSYTLFVGEIPEGKYVLHKCDNPPCVNPKHLYAGTAKDNMADCINRGRHGQMRKTHCQKGHKYTKENAHIDYKGHRKCKACNAEYNKKWRKRNLEKLRGYSKKHRASCSEELKEQRRQYQRDWASNNRDLKNIYQRRYREKKIMEVVCEKRQRFS